jgi:hypothetical protein
MKSIFRTTESFVRNFAVRSLINLAAVALATTAGFSPYALAESHFAKENSVMLLSQAIERSEKDLTEAQCVYTNGSDCVESFNTEGSENGSITQVLIESPDPI